MKGGGGGVSEGESEQVKGGGVSEGESEQVKGGGE